MLPAETGTPVASGRPRMFKVYPTLREGLWSGASGCQAAAREPSHGRGRRAA